MIKAVSTISCPTGSWNRLKTCLVIFNAVIFKLILNYFWNFYSFQLCKHMHKHAFAGHNQTQHLTLRIKVILANFQLRANVTHILLCPFSLSLSLPFSQCPFDSFPLFGFLYLSSATNIVFQILLFQRQFFHFFLKSFFVGISKMFSFEIQTSLIVQK